MTDLSRLSDEELIRALNAQEPEPEVAKMSDAELIAQLKASEEPSYLDSALDGAADAGRYLLEEWVAPAGIAIDSVTGAPTRAAVSAAADGQNPASAFWKQFASDPATAPTGKDLAQRMGVGNTALSERIPSLYSETGDEWLKFKRGGFADPTASGAVGLGVDVATDWTNAIPGIAALRLAAKTGAGTAKGLAKGTALATDLVTGTKGATKTLGAAGAMGRAAGEAVGSVVNPKRADDFEQMVEVAKRHGIPEEALSEAVEFGPGSFISRAQRAVNEGPAGESGLARHSQGVGEVESALARRVDEVSPRAAGSASEAGAAIQKAYDDGVETIFNDTDITYKKVQKYAPGLYINRGAREALDSKLNGLEKTAKGLAKRPVTKTEGEQSRQIIRAVEGIRAAKYNFKQTVEQMQRIGKIAYKRVPPGADIPVDQTKMQELYHALRDSVVTTVEKDVSKEFAQELIENNKTLGGFFENRSHVVNLFENPNMPAEKLLPSVFASSKRVEAVKNIVSKERMNEFTASYINDITPRNADGRIMFPTMVNNLKKNEAVLKAAIEPEQYKNLVEIANLGARYGNPIMSTSGTGASGSFRQLVDGILNGVVNQQQIDMLKARARGHVKQIEAPQPRVAGVPVPSKQQALRMVGKRTNRPAQIGKIMQSGSVSRHNNETDAQRRSRLRLKVIGD